MIDDRYYKGFEGEPEYIIRNSEDEGYSVWEGHFDVIMGAGLITPLKEGGLIYYWDNDIGFENNEENWKISNLDQAIFEVHSFDNSKALKWGSEDRVKDSIEVKDVLLKFLEDAKARNLDVYVQRD